MYFFREKLQSASLSFYRRWSLRDKIICSTLGILLFVLIYYSFTVNYVNALLGLILFFSGIFLLFKYNNARQKTSKVAVKNPATSMFSNPTKIETQDGSFSVTIPEYINIQNHQIKIASDISKTLDDLGDVFNQMIALAPSPVEAIKEFSEELTQELCKQPEIKVSFDVYGDINEQELVNKIIKILLAPKFYPIKKIDADGDLINIEYLEEDEECESIVIYKGYKIHLHKNQNNRWHYRIQNRTLSFLEIKRKWRRYIKKENAIAQAKKQIKEDMFKNWKNSIDIPE
jgi:Ca2+/Na+ antiporter